MAIKPNPTPSADPYTKASDGPYRTTGKKKDKDKKNKYKSNNGGGYTPPYSESPNKNSKPEQTTARPQQNAGTSGGASTAQKTQSGDRYSEDVPVPQTTPTYYRKPQDSNLYRQSNAKNEFSKTEKSGYYQQNQKVTSDLYVPKDRMQNGYGKTYSQPQNSIYSKTMEDRYYVPKSDTGYDYLDEMKKVLNSRKNAEKTDWAAPKTIKDGAVKIMYDRVEGDINSREVKENRNNQRENMVYKSTDNNTVSMKSGETRQLTDGNPISLFDFLDKLSGIGPNNEMAGEITQFNNAKAKVPDLVAKAQPKNNIENPVLNYDDMVRKPDAVYGINADEWIANAPENWENTYKDKWFYEVDNGRFYNKIIVPNIDGLKTAEKEILLEKPIKSILLYANSDKLSNSKNLATTLRDKLYIHNENEPDVIKPYTSEEANLDGSKPNAFLHTMWSAFLAYDFGEEFAKEITTAHEMLDEEQYADGRMYSQPEINGDKTNGVYSTDKAYPTLQQHMEMDLHNNALGIDIAKEIKQMTDAEVQEELEYYYQSGDDAEYFDKMYPEIKDNRKRLMFIVCLNAVQHGDAAIIWDKYGGE